MFSFLKKIPIAMAEKAISIPLIMFESQDVSHLSGSKKSDNREASASPNGSISNAKATEPLIPAIILPFLLSTISDKIARPMNTETTAKKIIKPIAVSLPKD